MASATLFEQELPSGRQLVITSAETVEIYRSGELEVSIQLTDEGANVSVAARRLQVDAQQALTLQAARVRIHSTEGTTLSSDGEVAIESEKDLRLTSQAEMVALAEMIHLN